MDADTDSTNEALPDEDTGNGSVWPELSTVEARILGSLMEKAVTTPEYYPLTLNALVLACNQKSNRDPVLALGEQDVLRGLDRLRHTHRLVALVHTAGSRADKYKHTLTQVIEASPAQAAVLCELLLRGPETVGELRTRASRLCPFDKLHEVQTVLDELASHCQGALVAKMPRASGRREARWMHLLAGEVSAPESEEEPGAQIPDNMDADEIRRLREELDQLKAEFEALRARLGDT